MVQIIEIFPCGRKVPISQHNQCHTKTGHQQPILLTKILEYAVFISDGMNKCEKELKHKRTETQFQQYILLETNIVVI